LLQLRIRYHQQPYDLDTVLKTKNLILVVGAPRSGTTLLQSILMRIDGVWFPSETHFFGVTKLGKYAPVDLSKPASKEKTLQLIREQVCARNDLDVDWPILEKELSQASATLANWFDVLLQHLAERRGGVRRIGEKSPNHLRVAEYILSQFRDAKMIHIIRDGRDVAVSHREAFGDKLSIAHLAVRWRYYQRAGNSVSRHWPDRYITVRYEDLVTDPQHPLMKMCEFLGETFSPALLNPHLRAEKGFARREKHKLRTLEPITSSRIGRYRSFLKPNELATFQIIAGKELNRHGYPLERVPLGRALLSLPVEVLKILVRRHHW
jgi:hypothetical protein